MASTSLTKQPTGQFGRKVRLEVGNDKESLIIDNLRVTFDILKANTKHPNPATIIIYNLREDHRVKLETGEWNVCRLFVGYGITDVDLRLLCWLDITRCNSVRQELDILSVLECGDGREAYNTGFTAVTLSSGATYEDVIDECLSNLPGVSEGYVNLGDKANISFIRGRVLLGQTHTILDDVARATNSEWSVQDNKLNFVPKTFVTDDLVPVIGTDSNLIGSPRANDKGLAVSCNLNPALKIGGLTELNSMFTIYNGQYKIDTVRFIGDTSPKGIWQSQLTLLGGKFTRKQRRVKAAKKAKIVQYDYITEAGAPR